jgi:FdhE protein
VSVASVAPAQRLEAIGRAHPEWQSWLAPLRLTLAHAGDRAYERAVPDVPRNRAADAPLLDGAELTVDGRVVARHVRALLSAAAMPGTPSAALRDAAASPALDPLALLEASLAGDDHRLVGHAAAAGVEAAALGAVAALAAMPLAQACARRWARHLADRGGSYCPLCGAWPALAEERGLERARRLRCGRCGSDWRTDWLRCTFCGTSDHRQLGSLVPSATGQTRRVETCAGCGAYLKTITTLTPAEPADIAALDLETVHLDVAALEAGFRRPAGLGRAPAVRLVARRRIGWIA